MSLFSTRFIDHGQGGEPACMHIAERDVPAPSGRQVMIEVAYAGVNRPDVLQRSGLYPPPPSASPYLGLEVAGTVVALGPDAKLWKVGDQVCALTPGGGYAEYCLADERHCLAVPKGFDLLKAAAIPENYFTVWTNLFERARVQAGEILLVHGGSSGIGLTAIQLAKAFGCRVWTTVGNAEKGIVDQGRLAGAGNTGDAGHHPERQIQIDVTQVVAARAFEFQPLASERRTLGRNGNPLAAREIVTGQRIRVVDDLLGCPLGHDITAMHPGPGAYVEHVVSQANGILVVFHHDDGVAQIALSFQSCQQPVIVAGM